MIGEDGKVIGVMKILEALKLARDKGLTLVEIAESAHPPVVKIVEFGKFRYQEEKKLRTLAKKARVSELKEVRFSPFIAANDYQTRLEKVKEFLKDKSKVRLVVVFTRPQMGSKQFGYDLLKRIESDLEETITVDMPPKFLGKHLIMIVSPLAKSKRAGEQESVSKKT